MNEKIELTDTNQDIIFKMSEGNPGAINVLMGIMTSNIDNDDGLSGLGNILMLDSLGIYGTDIYILHNDICRNELSKTIAVIRSVQLGFFNGNILKDACSRQDRSGVHLIPVNDLYDKVKNELPNFDNN